MVLGSRGFGGKSALDYLVKVRDMRFREALELLMRRNCIPLPPAQRTRPEAPKMRLFCLPQKSVDDTAAMDYLRLRGIDPYVIRDCQQRGIIYENRSRGKSNVVFLEPAEIGKDMNDCLLAKREVFESEHIELDEKRIRREARRIRYKIERL